MHDFCFTIPYGLILVAGGVIGYLKKGSTSSLARGVGTGLFLILAGYLSLKAFEKKNNSYFALVLVIALFDGFDNLEEGGLRTSSSISNDMMGHDNDKTIESLNDRVAFLNRGSSNKPNIKEWKQNLAVLLHDDGKQSWCKGKRKGGTLNK
ncbi:hypothetical protein V6N13_076731 [Hibiscus sabdariffa]|uniref:Uncharacterized protein n=2 Tax=Hibiscus sabdariffa TaxID=183260 RepID=A0ABR2N7A8_9ROSI